ncbi:MAG: WcaI family glycosyltransferase [Marivita sp.]|jgi:colanic acid biosynthesis glycosyl transferase WcaI
MRILILGINFEPEKIAIAMYTGDLARYFVERGAKIDVISAVPYYPEWKLFRGWKMRYYTERSTDGLRVTHCPLYVPANPTGIRRILHHASFALTAAPVAIWRALTTRPDIVFVVAPSLLSAPVGWAAGRLAGARTWLHIQDFEVEAAFITGLLKEDSRIGRAALAFERWTLARFDRVSTISTAMLAKLKNKHIDAHKTVEIRNWADLRHIIPIDGVSQMKAELGIETKFILLYSGNLANKQGLEILPELARLLVPRKDVTVVICGEGPMRARLVEMADGLANIRFLPLQPIERLNDLLGMADVHLLPQVAGAADLVMPSKLTNMLASGRPVVATVAPGTALADEVGNAGLIVMPGDAEALATAVERLLDDDALRRAQGIAARKRALDRWNRTAILGRLSEAFESLGITTER